MAEREKKAMFDHIQWLFFDIGSTLANEERVYAHLIRALSQQVNRPYEVVAELVLSAYQNNQNGFHHTVRQLGAVKPKWEPSLECVYEDASRVLEELHRTYKIGIIANQEPGCRQRLANMGIAQFLDLVVSSGEEGVSKPDPRLFQIALERSNCRPENAVMIGDRIDNDILPANRLGMRTVWIRQGYGRYWKIRGEEERPTAAVDCLSGLLDIL